jgi:hypothetical protein
MRVGPSDEFSNVSCLYGWDESLTCPCFSSPFISWL